MITSPDSATPESVARVVLSEVPMTPQDGLIRVLTTQRRIVRTAVGTGNGFMRARIERQPHVFAVDGRMPPTATADGAAGGDHFQGRASRLASTRSSHQVAPLHVRELLSDCREHGRLSVQRTSSRSLPLQRVPCVGSPRRASAQPRDCRQTARPLLAGRALDVPAGTGGLAPITEGRSNSAVAAALPVTEKTITKHTPTASSENFARLAIEDDNRKVHALLNFLNS